VPRSLEDHEEQPLKLIGITSTAILSLLLGIAGPAYAQHEPQGEKQDHPNQQETKHEQAKPAQPHAQHKPAQNKQQAHAQPQQKPQPTQQQSKHEQAKPTQQHAQKQPQQQQEHRQTQHAQELQRPERNRPEHAQQRQGNAEPHRTQEQQRVQRSAWDQHRSQHWDTDHRSWQQRGGYHGYRIPDDRFRGYFGSNHGFRINGLPFLVVGGYPRFQYDGYWFSLVDPWPETWGNDWYDNDDVYVSYVDNGYYLFDRRYPGTGIAISISR
jgi:hypothetical protein